MTNKGSRKRAKPFYGKRSGRQRARARKAPAGKKPSRDDGAGSVVVHDIPSNSVAVGNPARVIKKLKEL